MKSLSNTKSIITVLLLLNSCIAAADVISGKLEFVKKAPFTAVLYVTDTGNSDKKATINQKDKAFTTKVSVGSPDNIISFKNSDTFDHNIYASDSKQHVKFDVGLMTPGNETQLKMDWPQDSLVRIGCKIHPKMRTYIANIKSDHFHSFQFAKKVKSYDFKIEQVPTNKNQLILMMPKYDKLTLELKKGESKSVEIKRKGKVKATLTINRV